MFLCCCTSTGVPDDFAEPTPGVVLPTGGGVLAPVAPSFGSNADWAENVEDLLLPDAGCSSPGLFGDRERTPLAAELAQREAARALEARKEFDVVVDRSSGDKRMGLDTVAQRRPLALVVQTVRPDGMLRRWNEDHPESAVREGDEITEVNGEASGVERMYDILAQGDIVRLRIRRP